MANVSYELDEAAVNLIAEMFAQIKAAEVGISTVLAYYVRQNGIRGKVKLCEDRRSVEVVEEGTNGESKSKPELQAQGASIQ